MMMLPSWSPTVDATLTTRGTGGLSGLVDFEKSTVALHVFGSSGVVSIIMTYFDPTKTIQA